MKTSMNRMIFGVLLVVSLCAESPVSVGQSPRTGAPLPTRLSDAEFWKLVSDISEPGGYFRIVDIFTSNENEIGGIVTELRTRGVQGGVYLGVGPEQNLSYIS